jgi:phosphoribosylglycinamide formyltransferase-1
VTDDDLPVGILVSGRGSNLEAILKAVRSGFIRGASIRLVLSNRSGVRALEIARSFDVPSAVLEKRSGGTREEYDLKLIDLLERAGVSSSRGGLVLLAGFDRILSPEFVTHFSGRLINIHPSLLPAFPGLHAQKQALDHGVKVAGCTVHFVSSEVDGGPIIVQRTVHVMEGDTEETLSSRILEEEHRAYPEAVKLFLEGRLKIDGRRVVIVSD